MTEADGIVIVGVGCRFPGADNIDEFWRVLQNGENHVIEVPPDRWNADHYYDPDKNAPGKMYVRQAGFIPGFEKWDNSYFGIPDEEAQTMDPQQRIVLQCVDMAAQDGGFTRHDLQKGTTGVYIGAMSNDFNIQGTDDVLALGTYSVTGCHTSIISARVSYVYNLTGPALTIDTACSSSLQAVHIGSQALLAGDCDIAICGGVNYLLEPNVFVALSKARMLSPSGQCKAFTREADGYARGEGCGIVILKRLKDAQRDGNNVWGLIQSGTNQDGQHAQPITKPSQEQQEQLIKHIINKFHIDTSKVQVIEAHGTGTPVGDPIECMALGTVLGSKTHTKFIGSVKTNIGHLEAAAGAAGLIKVMLMIKHKMIVPSLWYTTDNEDPKLKLREHGFIVPTKCEPWNTHDKKIACVNSFGFGGTNVHVVVHEVTDDTTRESITSIIPPIVVISAHDQEAYSLNIQFLLEKLQTTEFDMQSLSYTTTCKRDIFPFREAILATDKSSLIDNLKNAKDNTRPLFTNNGRPKVVFVFCGVGTVWQDMGYALLEDVSFRKMLDDIDRYLKPLAGFSILSKLLEKSTDIISNPCVSHIAIFCYQVALAAMWKRFGVTPDVVIGQSVGEVAAAYVAGFLNLASAVNVIFHRSNQLASVNIGSMVVLRNVDSDKVKDYCRDNKGIEIAVFNSNTSCTLSGSEYDIGQVIEKAAMLWKDAKVTPLTVPCAYHSSKVVSASIMLKNTLSVLESQQKTFSMISTVTCEEVSRQLICSPEYWERNVRQSVQFSETVFKAADSSRTTIYLEIGPAPVLGPHIKNIFIHGQQVQCVSSVSKLSESVALGNAICQLFSLGIDVNWHKITPSRKHLCNLRFPLKTKKHLFRGWKTKLRTQGRESDRSSHPFVVPSKLGQDQWHVHPLQSSTNFLNQHLVKGHIIIPGVFYSEIAFEIGKTWFDKNTPLNDIEVSLEFLRQVKVDKSVHDPIIVTVKDSSPNAVFLHIAFGPNVVCKAWARRVENSNEKRIDLEKLKLSFVGKNTSKMSGDQLYQHLKEIGFEYGVDFKLLTGSVSTHQKSILRIELSEHLVKQSESLTVHPCVIDAMLQSTISMSTAEFFQTFASEKLFFIPVAIGSMKVYQKPKTHMTIFVQISNEITLETVRQFHYNIVLTDQNGLKIAEIENYIASSKRGAANIPQELRYHIDWHLGSSKTKIDRGKSATKKIIFCSIHHNFEIENILEKEGRSFQYLKEAESIILQVQNANIQQFDAIVMLFYKLDIDTPENVPDLMYNMSVTHCLAVKELLRYCRQHNPIPMFVVTENTQTSQLSTTCEINAIDAAIWGFVRSLNIESTLYFMTMIDAQPSILSVFDRIVDFIYNSLEQDFGHDTIISPTNLKRACLSRMPRQMITPPFRDFYTEVPALTDNNCFAVIKRGADFYLKQSEQVSKSDHSLVPIKIKTAFVPMFVDQMNKLKDENGEPTAVVALEIIGVVSPYNMKNDYSVVVFPTEVRTTSDVPSGCIVKMNKLRYFKPGLLSFILLFKRFASLAEDSSSVAVLCDGKPEWPHCLLKMILERSTSRCVTFIGKDDDMNVDCLVTFENIGDLILLLPSMCRKVVCLQHNLNYREQQALRSCKEFTLLCTDLTDLFKVERIGENLEDVVEWINQHCSEISKLHEEHPLVRSQISEVRLFDEEDSFYRYPLRKSLGGLFDKQSVYVITGGLTGLGWEMTKLLAEMGAGTIVSITRSRASENYIEERRDIEKKYACHLLSVTADVSVLSDVQNAFADIAKQTSSAPVRGIFHGAGIVNGKQLISINKENFESVFRPKVMGMLNLHAVTQHNHLDFFVVASSISSYVGMIGQGSYGAANCFMDAFVAWRRQKRLPGQTINWGALALGMAVKESIRETFQSRGHVLMSVEEIRSCFQEALLQNSSGTIYSRINWELAAKDLTISPKFPFQITTLIEENAPSVLNQKDSDDSFTITRLNKTALSQASQSEQLEILQALVIHVVKKVSGKTVNNFNESFVSLGFDSMSQQQMINVLDEYTSVRLPETYLLDVTDTVKKLIDYLHKQMSN